MTQDEKIRETLDLLRRVLKYEKETAKMDLYWNLLTECMNKHVTYAEYVGDKWQKYLLGRVSFLGKQKEELKELEQLEKLKQN